MRIELWIKDVFNAVEGLGDICLVLLGQLPNELFGLNKPWAAVVPIKIFPDGDWPRRSVSVFVEKFDSPAYHLLLGPFVIDVAGVRVVLAEVVVDPDLGLTLVVNADHVFLHNEVADLIIDQGEPVQRRNQDVQVVGPRNILDLAQLERDSFCVERACVYC